MRRRNGPDGEPGSATHLSLAQGLRLVETAGGRRGPIRIGQPAGGRKPG
jgi:hypothetical protein